jgi:hypothetical protein
MCIGILPSVSVHFKVILHFYVAFVPNVMRVYRGVEVMFLTIQLSLFRAAPSDSKSGPLTFKSPGYSLDTRLVDTILYSVVLIQVPSMNQTHLPSSGTISVMEMSTSHTRYRFLECFSPHLSRNVKKKCLVIFTLR